jgi:hypothetical protein
MTLLNTCVADAVSLDIVRSGSDVTISWPAPSSGFVLESTLSLGTPDWEPVSEGPTLNNNRWNVTVPVGPQGRYFRLEKH